MTFTDIFFQFFGFLMQVLPVALLSIAPFPDQALRLPRKKLILLFGGCMLLFSAGYTLLACLIFLPDGSHDALLRQSSNLYMLICVVLWITALFFFIREAAIKKVIIIVLLIYYAAALFILSSIPIAPFYDEPSQALIVYDSYTIVVCAILLAVTCPLLYLFLKRKILFCLSHLESRSLQRNCIYMIFVLILFFVCSFSLSTFKFYYSFSDFSVALLLVAFILTDCILFFMLFAEARLTAQNQHLGEQLRSFNEQYLQINDNIARARRDRHDIRHHLNVISAMNHRGEQKELEEYLLTYEASFLELEAMSLCGYPAFDNILQYYIEYAQKNNINVETNLLSVKESLGFDIIDLTVMLGNLMENAIEACNRLPLGQPRYIRLSARKSNASFLLKIENSCGVASDERPDFSEDIGFMSSKHTLGHGQGLSSIQYVARKYGGTAEFKKADGVFTARIVMNIP